MSSGARSRWVRTLAWSICVGMILLALTMHQALWWGFHTHTLTHTHTRTHTNSFNFALNLRIQVLAPKVGVGGGEQGRNKSFPVLLKCHVDSYLLHPHAGLSWKADLPQMGSSSSTKNTLHSCAPLLKMSEQFYIHPPSNLFWQLEQVTFSFFLD